MQSKQLTSGPPHVVIVGGGITGLSAAFYIERMAQASGAAVACTLVERSARLGGKIITETIDDPAGAFLLEGGPDSFVAQKPWAAQLARELGLAGQLIDANQAYSSTFVLTRGRPIPMPVGMALIFPTRLGPFLRSPLLSWRGRLRMLAEPWMAPRRDDGDESLAQFIRRRFGAEALDRLAEPLLAGIHSADPARQSLLATFPRLRALEQEHGSVLRGMRAARRAAGAQSPFITLRGGIGELVAALRAQIRSRLIAGQAVLRIEHMPGAPPRYQLALAGGERLSADVVILATPAAPAAELVDPFQPALAAALRELRAVTTVTISLAYPSHAFAQPLAGFGLVIPQSEHRAINALTISSQKFVGRAPAGYHLLRVFAGGARTPASAALDDERLLGTAQAELRAILGVTSAPLWSRIYRWPAGSPQYDVGHAARVARIERMLPAGLLLAGAPYHGVGLPDCIRQAHEAATWAVKRYA